MRITALLAAGSTIEIGGPTTSQITKSVRNNDFLNKIASEIDNFYSPESCHFEHIFHTLETLYSYQRGWAPRSVSEFKPPAGAFFILKEDIYRDQSQLLDAKRFLIETIFAQVNDALCNFDLLKYNWFSNFFNEAIKKCAWDIATLNYDNFLESCIEENLYTDGFTIPYEKFYRFDPLSIEKSSQTRILHLHGNIKYGYPRYSNPNNFIFEETHEDLCKYSDPKSAKDTWFYRSNDNSQAREENVIGPIITGLRKTDKLICHPYDSFYSIFRNAIRNSPRLLIAGYSFGDYYLNSILNRIYRLYGNDRRIVVIDYFPDEELWHCDPNVSSPDNMWSHEKLYFLSMGTNSTRPLGNSLKFKNPLISSDKCCRIYLKGMREAIENHGKDILDFLMS